MIPFEELSILSGDKMLKFVAGLFVGLVVAALLYRNNKAKFDVAVEKAVAEAKKLKN